MRHRGKGHKGLKTGNDSGKDIPYWTPAALFPSSKIQRRISEFSWNRPVYKFSWMKNMTWLRLNVLSSQYPSGSFCHTHCLSRSSPFLFGNLIVSLTFLPQNTVHIVCSLFSHSTPAGCARSMLRVSCIIFIHPAFAVKLHGKILLPIFLCGLVAEVDFDKEEEISSFLIFFVWGSFVISFFDTFFFNDLYILQCPKGYQ